MRLCGLMVDHRRAGAEDLRFTSLMGTRNFLSFSMLVTWRKIKPAFFSDGSVISQHVPLAHTHTHTRHVNVTHVTLILSSLKLRLQVNHAIRMSWSVHFMSFWSVRLILSTVEFEYYICKPWPSYTRTWTLHA